MSDATTNVVKGFTISQPVLGRISIGHTEIINGEEHSFMDDHFHITTLEQNLADKSWVPDPLEKQLLDAADEPKNEESQQAISSEAKLRAIPVRIAYNDVGLNLNNRHRAYDKDTGRLLCSGDGHTAQRLTTSGVRESSCPGADACQFGATHGCTAMTRVYFKIEGCTDELGVYLLRTTSVNGLNYLQSRLIQLSGLTNGKIAGMPLMLVLRTKTSSLSFGRPYYFADLVTRPGESLLTAIRAAADFQEDMAAAGLNLEAMESNLRQGLLNGRMVDQLEDPGEWFSDEDMMRSPNTEKLPPEPGFEVLDNNLRLLSEAVQKARASATPKEDVASSQASQQPVEAAPEVTQPHSDGAEQSPIARESVPDTLAQRPLVVASAQPTSRRHSPLLVWAGG